MFGRQGLSEGLDTQVQGTNDDAQISKLSCSRAGYFQDDFVHHFVRRPVKRSPLINRGYYSRYAALRQLLLQFLDKSAAQGQASQVLVLGAGFDTTWFQLAEAGRAPARYLELDFKQVTQRKVAIIHQQPELWNMVTAAHQQHAQHQHQQQDQQQQHQPHQQRQAHDAEAAPTPSQNTDGAVHEVQPGQQAEPPAALSAPVPHATLYPPQPHAALQSPRQPPSETPPSQSATQLVPSSPVLDHQQAAVTAQPTGTDIGHKVEAATVALPQGTPLHAPAPPMARHAPPSFHQAASHTAAAVAAPVGPSHTLPSVTHPAAPATAAGLHLPRAPHHAPALPPPTPVPEGMHLNASAGELCSVGYNILPVDLRDASAMTRALQRAGLDPHAPTYILSECVLVYMEPEASNQLLRWLASHFTNAVVAVYEQIKPYDAFGRQMMSNLELRGCPLRGLPATPTLHDHCARLRACGWPVVRAWDMDSIYKWQLDPEDKARVESLEVFDEFEEWHLIQEHYCISIGIKTSKEGVVKDLGFSAQGLVTIE